MTYPSMQLEVEFTPPSREPSSAIRLRAQPVEEIDRGSHLQRRDLRVVIGQRAEAFKLTRSASRNSKQTRHTFSSIFGVGPPPPSPLPKRRRHSSVTPRFLLLCTPFSISALTQFISQFRV